MTTSGIERRNFRSGKGSVLMEFVLVLPIYVAVIGGALWLGMRSLDAVNLRSSDHWSVWSEGNRFQIRTPALIALRGMFPRFTLVTAGVDRRLEDEHGYLQFLAGKTTIIQTRPDYIDNWMSMPFTTTGERKPFWMLIPEFQMTSSRFGNKYTQCIIMRAKASNTSKRHWHSSLIADGDIWKFEDKTSEYPKKWELKLMENAKYKDDTKEEGKEPAKIEFYKRFEPYEEWSVPAK
ncbi:MAG: pilus assembly protein [Lentisphaeria bacterium]|nr:pilus assembly protein [Lentisphaeria bacterium]